jgi:itaconate CoA-transferase
MQLPPGGATPRTPGGTPDGEPSVPGVRPLSGITVLAVEQAVSAPICTRHLGDLGARVIKVENLAGGDFTRGFDDYVHGMSSYFTWVNRNKESVALDLKHPLGREVLQRLVARADVLVQNLAPGAAARLGLDPGELRGARPELITVGISGYGNGGPMAGARAYDLLAQSEGGSVSVTGAIAAWAGQHTLAECRQQAEDAALGMPA